MLATFIF